MALADIHTVLKSNERKEMGTKQTGHATRLVTTQKRWYGRLRLFQGVSAVDVGPLLCHRNAFDVS